MFRRLTVRRTVHNVQGSCHLLFCAGICWSGGPVTMSYTRAKNSSSSNAYKVIHDAAGAIDSYVDFADYDVNGDDRFGYLCHRGPAGRAHGRTHE